MLTGLLTGLVVMGGAAAVLAHSQQGGQSERDAVTTVAAPAPAAQAPAAPVTTSSATEPMASVRPTHLELGEIEAPVVPVALDGGALTPPSDPTTLGWWGREAGSAHGTTLLVGHTVHTGGGALDDLEEVPIGTVAEVNGVEYLVTSNEVISKASLAGQATDLFDQSGQPRLVVVTCEGYDPTTGHYDSNVVLTAIPR
jgi:hypothetical protein